MDIDEGVVTIVDNASCEDTALGGRETPCTNEKGPDNKLNLKVLTFLHNDDSIAKYLHIKRQSKENDISPSDAK
jgi:hypothetical protein